jgi:hypothetical protein
MQKDTFQSKVMQHQRHKWERWQSPHDTREDNLWRICSRCGTAMRFIDEFRDEFNAVYYPYGHVVYEYPDCSEVCLRKALK